MPDPLLKSDLRGIETHVSRKIGDKGHKLKSDLRGIETSMHLLQNIRLTVLKSDLRGIETLGIEVCVEVYLAVKIRP